MVTLRRLCRMLLPLLLLVAGSGELYPQEAAPSQQQKLTALRKTAELKGRSFQAIAAKLRLGIDTAAAWRQLDTMLSAPTGDMFWLYPAAAFYHYCRDLMSDRWRDRFRETFGRYTSYRGDTENHFLMHYGALLLFSQEWPDLPGSAWFNGKSSRENYAEARSYLEHWIDESAREGITEWDSPRYLYYYITPLLTLADFTADTLLRRRFRMMLELQLADYAAEYLNGSYCGAHSRDGDNSVINPRNSEAYSYAQFYFEDTLTFVLGDLAFAAMSPFTCPEIIRCIAHDRERPFVHRERKRSRAKMRYAAERHSVSRKYDYMTPDYCLGSIDGGLQQPIQQHSWGITFAHAKPYNTIFGLHPQASATELGTFFPEEPELMVSDVTQSKASYGSENKWVGGSPYERLFQWKSTLLAVYDIPEGTRFPHVDIFIPKTLDTLIRDAGGWTVGRMGGTLVGIRMIGREPVEWIEEEHNWRLRSHDLHARYIVECASEREMSLAGFIERLARPSPADRLQSSADAILYRSIREETIEIQFEENGAGRMLVDAMAPESPADALFLGPHLRSTLGSGILEMRCGELRRTLDFGRGEVRE